MTDPVVETIFQLQIDRGDGPLIAALAEQAIVTVRDTAAEPRWPVLAGKVAELGVGSAVHLPLGGGEGRTSSAVVIGSSGQSACSACTATMPARSAQATWAVAEMLARHASIAVDAARQEETLAHVIGGRKLVAQRWAF